MTENDNNIPKPSLSNMQTGQDAAEPDPSDEMRTRQRRGVGRRVNLIRTEDGTYEVRMGHRMIQGFCEEFEDITRFQLPYGIQQQVRINVEPVGRAREYIFSPTLTTEQADVRVPPPPPNLMAALPHECTDGSDNLMLQMLRTEARSLQVAIATIERVMNRTKGTL